MLLKQKLLEQSVLKNCVPCEGPTWDAVLEHHVKSCSPWERSVLEDCVSLSHVRDPTLEQGKSRRNKTERACDGLIATPISHVPALLVRGGSREIGKEVGPRKMEALEEKGVLRSAFISHYPTLI